VPPVSPASPPAERLLVTAPGPQRRVPRCQTLGVLRVSVARPVPRCRRWAKGPRVSGRVCARGWGGSQHAAPEGPSGAAPACLGLSFVGERRTARPRPACPATCDVTVSCVLPRGASGVATRGSRRSMEAAVSVGAVERRVRPAAWPGPRGGVCIVFLF